MAKLDEYITQKVRAKYATVKVGGKSKFPIPDKRHAVAAERMKGMAKPPLTSAQSASVDAKAARFGAGPDAKKKNAGK